MNTCSNPSTTGLVDQCTKMTDVQDEAIRAVSAVIASSDEKLISAIDAEQQKWQQQLNVAKTTARTMLADVLSQREALRSSLSTAAQLWQVLKPQDDEQHNTPTISKRNEAPPANHFLATPEQMIMVKALQNVSHTILLVEFILAAPEALEKAHESLVKVQKDGLLEVQSGNAALLVDAHAVLTAVERLRDVVLLDAPQELQASSSPSNCFSKARETRNLLEDIVIRGVFSNILPISQTNPRLLVATARVIEAEGSEDEWWSTYLHRCANSHRGQDVRPYGVLNYKQRALSTAVESLQYVFREKERDIGLFDSTILEVVNSNGNSSNFPMKDPRQHPHIDISEIIQWIEQRRQENETVRRFVTPCIPPSFAFANLYEKELHRQFMRLVTRLLHLVRTDGSTILSEEDLIQLTTWYSKYQESVGEQAESIDSFLSDSDRQNLISALQKHCADSIDAQVDAVLAPGRRDTKARGGKLAGSKLRRSSIDNVKLGLRRTDLPDAILGFVTKLVNRMMSLRVQGLDYAIATTVAERMNAFQIKARDIIRDERAKSFGEEFGLYLCATANNMARCLEQSEDLREVFVPTAVDQNRSDIENKMDSIIEGFRISASMCLVALINGMAENLSVHATRFYAPHTGTEVMLDIIATLEDYFSEYGMHLLPYHFEHLAIESLKRIVMWYIAPFLRLSDHRPEEGAARRFTSLPTFDEAGVSAEDSIMEVEAEQEISSRRSENDRGERRSSKGLSTMNGEAVIAQIDKDMSNLTRFMRRKVVLYQKKQLEPTLEPMSAIRSLYSCAPTAFGLSDAFRHARAVIMRSTRPSWVRGCGVEGQLTARDAEVIWESRKDVNPVVLLEAITMIRTSNDITENMSPMRSKDSHKWLLRNERQGGEGGAVPLEDIEQPVNSLMWAPLPSKLRWK